MIRITHFSILFSHFNVEYLALSPIMILIMAGIGTTPKLTLCRTINTMIWSLNMIGECDEPRTLTPPIPPYVKSTAAKASSLLSPSYSSAIAEATSLLDAVL